MISVCGFFGCKAENQRQIRYRARRQFFFV